MTFADELRNAPEEKLKEELAQREKDWEFLIDLFYKYIKAECKRCAEWNHNYARIAFYEFTSKMNDGTGLSFKEAEIWERLKGRVHAIPQSDTFASFTKADVNDVNEQIVHLLVENDGLTVHPTIEEFMTYRQETKYVKRSEKARSTASFINTLFPLNTMNLSEDEGYYKTVRVEDGYRYRLEYSIEW